MRFFSFYSHLSPESPYEYTIKLLLTYGVSLTKRVIDSVTPRGLASDFSTDSGCSRRGEECIIGAWSRVARERTELVFAVGRTWQTRGHHAARVGHAARKNACIALESVRGARGSGTGGRARSLQRVRRRTSTWEKTGSLLLYPASYNPFIVRIHGTAVHVKQLI